MDQERLEDLAAQVLEIQRVYLPDGDEVGYFKRLPSPDLRRGREPRSID